MTITGSFRSSVCLGDGLPSKADAELPPQSLPFNLECRPPRRAARPVECRPVRAIPPPQVACRPPRTKWRCVPHRERRRTPPPAPAANHRRLPRFLRDLWRDPLDAVAGILDAAIEAEARASPPTPPAEERPRRKPIPSAVRRAVWERDGGRCVACGTDRDLQFDHVIPVSKGGSNAPENLELRCGRDNRAKGNRIE